MPDSPRWCERCQKYGDHHTDRCVPPEVVLYQGTQLHARTASGGLFPHYIECAGGCGYVIGCGDAIDEVWHQSCWEAAYNDAYDNYLSERYGSLHERTSIGYLDEYK